MRRIGTEGRPSTCWLMRRLFFVLSIPLIACFPLLPTDEEDGGADGDGDVDGDGDSDSDPFDPADYGNNLNDIMGTQEFRTICINRNNFEHQVSLEYYNDQRLHFTVYNDGEVSFEEDGNWYIEGDQLFIVDGGENVVLAENLWIEYDVLLSYTFLSSDALTTFDCYANALARESGYYAQYVCETLWATCAGTDCEGLVDLTLEFLRNSMVRVDEELLHSSDRRTRMDRGVYIVEGARVLIVMPRNNLSPLPQQQVAWFEGDDLVIESGRPEGTVLCTRQ